MKKDLDVDVVRAAERRIVEAFNKNKYLTMGFSGGKDSICTADITVKTMLKHNIDFSRLYVMFYDEEGVYPDFVDTVKRWRQKFIELGATFYWFCLPIKHFNCVNKLANDESFICWEPGKEDRWIREKPPFAISHHKDFRAGMTYQAFDAKVRKGIPAIVGLRMYESVQRLAAIGAMRYDQDTFVYPIYDWQDNDVWLYLRNNDLEFPITYLYLYKVGVPVNRLRISQFFSVDTIRTLPKTLEFYPDLYERILTREPNIDLVLLYWDSEMFRSTRQSKMGDDDTDYKKKFYDELKRAKKYPEEYPSGAVNSVLRLCTYVDDNTTQSSYQALYTILIAGDPKNRMTRVLQGKIKTSM
jgi:predicted phosphoadenosine phosphosulfate sulfurtransferase